MRPSVILLIAVVATLIGATFVVLDRRSPAPQVARHTVAEYRADAPLRRDMLNHCVNDPGTMGKSPDCINVREAERLESRGSLRDLPPVGLDPNAAR